MDLKQQIERHVQVLCGEIGARPTGSLANRNAVDYACRELERCALAVRRQEFDCMDWEGGGAALNVDGRDVPVVPAPYARGCEVRGELVPVDTPERLRTASLAGKVILLHGALAAQPLMPKSFVFWNPDEHKEIISLLEQSGALAVLTVSPAADRPVPIIEDGDFLLPCAIVLPEYLEFLLQGTRASLALHAVRKPAKAANVIAVRGTGGSKVCFSAHIDTAPDTCGALDNASGAAVLLALASALRERELPFPIEFVLFNGEDYYSTPGETTYLAQSLSAPSEYICAFNLDGVGLRGSDTAYSFFDCSEEMLRRMRGAASALPGLREIEPWPQGDHTLFVLSGVPAVAVTSCGIFELADSVLHTREDTPEWIDPEKLAALVGFLLACIEATI